MTVHGIGIDVVEVARIAAAAARHGENFLARLFTPAERAYCDAKKSPAIHYAARFAAKEAFLKAMGTGLSDGLAWRDMEVVNGPNGKPELKLAGRAAELFRQNCLSGIFLSLSHDGNLAVASVILEGE